MVSFRLHLLRVRSLGAHVPQLREGLTGLQTPPKRYVRRESSTGRHPAQHTGAFDFRVVCFLGRKEGKEGGGRKGEEGRGRKEGGGRKEEGRGRKEGEEEKKGEGREGEGLPGRVISVSCGGLSLLWWSQSLVVVSVSCGGLSLLWWSQSFVVVSVSCGGLSLLWWSQSLVVVSVSCGGLSLLRWS